MRGLLVVLLALAALAAGCGSEPASLQGSDDALKEASTSRVEWSLEGKGMLDWGPWRSSGLIDYAKGRGEMVFKGKSDSAPVARALFIGHDSYLGAKVAGTMYWVKQTVEPESGTDRFIPGPGGTSPDRLLEDLTKASKKLEKLGTEEIRGVSATHYRAHLDKTKLGIDGQAEKPLVVDAWIDEQGRPRRIRVPAGGENDLVAVVDLFDFGVSVDIDAPPGNEIVSEDKFDKVMENECADVGKDLKDANPLCLLFGSSGLSSGPTETMPRRVSDY
jgi:hypothetical protein